jgi:predicted MFS family arabinose efflux permease
MRWVFAAGAGLVLVGRVIGTYKGSSLRIRRLYRILITSAVLYCASALMMFYSRGTNDWVAFLLAGLVIQIYASWMIDHETKKTEN